MYIYHAIFSYSVSMDWLLVELRGFVGQR